MKKIFPALLLCFALQAAAQEARDPRVPPLQKRVTKLEGRVTRLESGAQPSSRPPKADPDRPVGVRFLEKRQVSAGRDFGVRFYVEFSNLSDRKFSGFTGRIVFLEKGEEVYARDYETETALAPGEKFEVAFTVKGSRTREYLRALKAREISAELRAQRTF